MISYAQNFEDIMLYRVFRDCKQGFYVDVGAADPVNLSVTKLFYDLGWDGINIEPHPDLYQALVAARARDINLNCGAGDRCNEAAFFELPVKEWSSFNPTIRALAVERGEVVSERTIPIITLNEILDHYAHGRQIDFLKVDVEGWERAVLSGIDLRRHRPTIVLVEAILQGTSEPCHLLWEDLLIQANYRPIYFDGVNKFYLPEERRELARYFAAPPNVFDEFISAETARLKSDVQSVTAALKESEHDRAARLDQVQTLTAAIQESERDRAARFDQVQTLTAAIQESERDRAARFDQIQTLTQLISDLNEAHSVEVQVLKERIEQLESHPALLFCNILARVWNKCRNWKRF